MGQALARTQRHLQERQKTRARQIQVAQFMRARRIQELSKAPLSDAAAKKKMAQYDSELKTNARNNPELASEVFAPVSLDEDLGFRVDELLGDTAAKWREIVNEYTHPTSFGDLQRLERQWEIDKKNKSDPIVRLLQANVRAMLESYKFNGAAVPIVTQQKWFDESTTRILTRRDDAFAEIKNTQKRSYAEFLGRDILAKKLRVQTNTGGGDCLFLSLAQASVYDAQGNLVSLGAHAHKKGPELRSWYCASLQAELAQGPRTAEMLQTARRWATENFEGTKALDRMHQLLAIQSLFSDFPEFRHSHKLPLTRLEQPRRTLEICLAAIVYTTDIGMAVREVDRLNRRRRQASLLDAGTWEKVKKYWQDLQNNNMEIISAMMCDDTANLDCTDAFQFFMCEFMNFQSREPWPPHIKPVWDLNPLAWGGSAVLSWWSARERVNILRLTLSPQTVPTFAPFESMQPSRQHPDYSRYIYIQLTPGVHYKAFVDISSAPVSASSQRSRSRKHT